MGRRIRWLALVLVLAFGLVLAQLVNIQEREAPKLNANRTNPRNLVLNTTNKRGLILAANGQVLARSVKIPHPAVGARKYYRQYATGSLYSGIIGWTSPYYGTAGVERVYNQYLKLHTQPAQTLGQLLNPPSPTTDNVITTILPSLQRDGITALQSIPNTNKDGAVVVLNATTGAVLTMDSNPFFTNNPLATPDLTTSDFTNEQAAYAKTTKTSDHEGYLAYPPLAYWDPLAPGSTFKVVTSTAVYNLKPTLAGFTYKISGCTGKDAIPNFVGHQICNDANTPTNASPCGGNLTAMLPESCDPGYAMLGLRLGATTLYQQASLFGYNSTPPIDLNTVQKSDFPTPSTISTRPAELALAAFGQGTVTATALQGAMVAQGLADTGKVMTPHVVSRITGANSSLVKAFTPTLYKQAASAGAAQAVGKLMQLVASTPHGTAHQVGFPATEDVAVKTGTAQAGVGNDQTVDWMIGFAPASDPRVAIAVVVPQQAVSASGAAIAGPIMKKMMADALAAVPTRTTPVATVPPTSTPVVVRTTTGTAGVTTTTIPVTGSGGGTTTTTQAGATTTTTTSPTGATTTTTAPAETTTTTPAATTTSPPTTTTTPPTTVTTTTSSGQAQQVARPPP